MEIAITFLCVAFIIIIAIYLSKTNKGKPGTTSIQPQNDNSEGENNKISYSYTFTLTVEDGSIDDKLNTLLKEAMDKGGYDATARIASFLALHKVRWRELEDYLNEYKNIYQIYIKNQISATPKWASLSDKDRGDLSIEFRKKACDSLRIRPRCNLQLLFLVDIGSFSDYKKITGYYGFESLEFYLSEYEESLRVHDIPADHYNRKRWEDLVVKKMAVRGDLIPIPSILSSMTLKIMNEFIGLDHPKFTRKQPAYEYLKDMPDIKDRIHQRLGTRTLFQLKTPAELPFTINNLYGIFEYVQYYKEVAALLFSTYYKAFTTRKYLYAPYNNLKLLIHVDDDGCAYCKEMALKKSSHTPLQTVPPYHIGCQCYVTI